MTDAFLQVIYDFAVYGTKPHNQSLTCKRIRVDTVLNSK